MNGVVDRLEDPIRKLVTPRMAAAVVMLPVLTILSDFVGMMVTQSTHPPLRLSLSF